MTLDWLPRDLMRDIDDWSLTNTVTSSMRALQEQASPLFRPLEEMLPQPRMPEIRMPEIQIPEVPHFNLGKAEDWLPTMPDVSGGGFTLPGADAPPEAFTVAASAARTTTPAAMPQGQPTGSVALPVRMDTSSRDANLRQWAPALRAVEARTGLSAAATWAIIQAENGGGQSPLSANDNNYFSISYVNRPKQAGPGTGGRFARYETPQDSLDDFVDLISTSPRYQEAWANRGDPQKFIAGLVKGGYIVPEPGFPVETWIRNTAQGATHFNQTAPAPSASQRASEARAASGERGGLDVQGITQAYQGVPYTFGGPGGRSDPRLGTATDCLVAGTRIETLRGPVPIESVMPGDYALTRTGYRPITGAWLVGERPVYQVTLTDGREIVGTGNHRVWTQAGWKELQTLDTSDTLYPCGQKSSSSTGTGIVAIPIPIVQHSVTTTSGNPGKEKGSHHFIGLSGYRSTARSRRATRSTTSTTTPSTTRQTTWNVFLAPGIEPNRPMRGLVVSASVATAERRSPRSQGLGTPADDGFVVAVASRHGAERPDWIAARLSALNAASPPSQSTSENSGIAATGVQASYADARRAWAPSSVRSVAVPSSRSSHNGRSTAAPAVPGSAVNIVGLPEPMGMALTYDLEIDGPAEFFANGVLVHNCSGFTSAIWRDQYGLNLPAHTDAAYNQLRQSGAPEVSQQDARAGDLVFYMGAGSGGAITHHMGIYAGDGKVLDMSTSGGSGVRVRDVGHAGRHVILRDPRVNQQAPRTAEAPPPIVPTGLAEASGGQKPSQREINAASQETAAVPPPTVAAAPVAGAYPPATGASPLDEARAGLGAQQPAMLRSPLDVQGPPIRDDYAQPATPVILPGDGGTAPTLPYDPRDADQGPRESPLPVQFDPRIRDEGAGARELPVQRPAVPQVPVVTGDDPGVAPAPPRLDPSIAPPTSALVAPGSPYAPDVMPEARPDRFATPEPTVTQRVAEAPGRFYQDVGAPIVERVRPRTGPVEAFQQAAESGFRTPEPVTDTDRRLVEDVRTVLDPVMRPTQEAIRQATTSLERALGAPPGSMYQAAQDVSNFLGPTAPILGAVRRGGGMADDASRAVRQAADALPPGARPITLTPEQEAARLRLVLEGVPDDLKPMIQDAAADAGWYHAQRRGVLPDDVVQRLAAEAGRSHSETIRTAQVGRAWSAEETVALRNAVSGQTVKVADLGEAVSRADSASAPALIGEFTREAARLDDLLRVREGARAEAGRALRQWGFPSRALDDPNAFAQAVVNKFRGDTQKAAGAIAEYNQMVRDGASPAQLAGYWANVMADPIAPSEVFALYRRFNMLSGPRTFEVNAISGGLELVGDAAQRAGIRAATGHPGEAVRIATAPIIALPRAAKAFAQTFAHGITDEMAQRGDLPRTMSSRMDPGGARNIVRVLETPDRINGATDAFVRTLAEQMVGVDEAVRATRGLTGEARDARIAELLANPTKEMAAAIEEGANRITFQGDMGALGRALRHVQQVPIIGNIALPFLTTVYHIGARGIDRSPLGLATTAQELIRSAPGVSAVGRGAYRAGVERPAGVPPLAPRLRDNVIGTAAAWWAYSKAEEVDDQGLPGLTGMGPDDPEKRAELRALGWQPYSIRIGDQYWSYANFGPFAFPLAQAAAASEARRYAKDDATTAAMIGDAAKRFASMVTEMSVVSGIGAIVKASQDPDRYGTQWLTQFAQTLVPAGSLVNTIGQATDPTVRRAERDDALTQVQQGVASRIPGLRETVPAAQDPLGRDIQSQQTGLRALNPARPTTVKDEPVIQAYLDAKVDIGKPKDSLTVAGTKIDLTPEEQREWNRIRGEEVTGRVAPQVSGPAWERLPAESRARRLKEALDRANERADAVMQRTIGTAEIRRRVLEVRGRKAG